MTAPDIHLWKYQGRAARNYSGLNLSGTVRGCRKLAHGVERLLMKGADRSLSLELSTPPSLLLRSVNRSEKVQVYRELLLTLSDETQFLDFEDALELRLDRVNLELLAKAVEAISRGVGDFSILDAPLWMWWSYTNTDGRLAITAPEPGYNPGP